MIFPDHNYRICFNRKKDKWDLNLTMLGKKERAGSIEISPLKQICFIYLFKYVGVFPVLNLYLFSRLLIFRVLPMVFNFAAINFRESFCYPVANMGVSNFCGALFSRIFLPRESRDNKSYANINKFTVLCVDFWRLCTGKAKIYFYSTFWNV